MGRYVARRLLQAIPVFFGATFIVFTMVYALPGDPIRALNGERPISESAQASLRDRYNLDDPLVIQYAKYIGNLATGDFGETFRGEPVSDILKQKFPVTARLALGAFIFECVLRLMAGIVGGLRRGCFIDNLGLLSTSFIVAMPVFVHGFVAQLVLGVQLAWFPIAGIQNGWFSYILPSIV